MKKFFDRLRRWTIKKLGGYTEQFQPLQRQITRKVDMPVQNVQAQISVTMPEPDSAIDFKRYCEDQVLRMLMRELYRSGFILWVRQNDTISQKVNIRATLCVVNTNDLKQKFQY